jgi:hypothetical protein
VYARGPLAFRRDRRKLAWLCATGTVTFLFADIEGNGLCVCRHRPRARLLGRAALTPEHSARPTCRGMREVRRVRHPAATAHSRQNGPVEWAGLRFAEPAWLLGSNSADGLAAQSDTGRQKRPVPIDPRPTRWHAGREDRALVSAASPARSRISAIVFGVSLARWAPGDTVRLMSAW